MKHSNIRHVRSQKTKATATYDLDIGQEFKDIKTTFSNRLDKIETKLDEWKMVFDRQLTQLNDNMKNVMDKLAQHEFRFTEHESRIRTLENNKIKTDTHKQTMSEMAKLGWVAAKILLAVGGLVGAVGGCGWILKFLAIV